MRISPLLQLIVFLMTVEHISLYRRKFRRAHLEAKKLNMFKSNGKSAIINAFSPQQIHISYGKSPADIVILWATRIKEPKMEVQYNADPRMKYISVVGEQIEFANAGVKSAKFWHRAYITNLKPGEKYFYRIFSKQNGAISEVSYFTVPPTKVNVVHSYMVLADMGTRTINLPFIVQEAINKRYTAVFHIGDIAYDLQHEKGLVGDKYLNSIQPMASKIPYMVSPGDHELGSDFQEYCTRFSMPNLGWPMKADKLWYSFDVGAAHFISLNTEVFFSHKKRKNPQLEWLKKDLQTVNSKRNNRPWVIVLGHRPLYSSCDNRKDCLNETATMQKELEDLFFRNGVDLYIGGHYHNYERSWPVYKQKVIFSHYKNPKAPVYITVGTLGSIYLNEKINKPNGVWSAKRISDGIENYGTLDVINATHLKWRVFAAQNNKKLDLVWIIQHHPRRFGDPKEYLTFKQKPPRAPLPPEPNLEYKKHDEKYMYFRSYRPNFHRKGMLYKEAGLIIALMTVCSFAVLLCVFYKKLWRRARF